MAGKRNDESVSGDGQHAIVGERRERMDVAMRREHNESGVVSVDEIRHEKEVLGSLRRLRVSR